MKVISFDLDGTLVDLNFDKILWSQEIPKRYARRNKLNVEKARETVQKEYDEIGEQKIEWYELDYWLKKFDLGNEKKEIIYSLKHLIMPYPDAKPVLESLKQKKFRLIILSHSSRSLVESKLEATELGGYFEKVFSVTSDYKTLKGEQFYKKACQELGIECSELTHVGDHEQFDYEIPKALGVNAFLVDRTRKKNGLNVVYDLKEFEEAICSQ